MTIKNYCTKHNMIVEPCSKCMSGEDGFPAEDFRIVDPFKSEKRIDGEERLSIACRILDWLFTHDGKFNDKTEWREAFTKMLKETLDL